jgi:hypothetical protein
LETNERQARHLLDGPAPTLSRISASQQAVGDLHRSCGFFFKQSYHWNALVIQALAGKHMVGSLPISLMRKAAICLGRTEESEMKQRLLATVAFAAIVGFGGIAAAQTGGGETHKSTSGSMQEQKGGGMSGMSSHSTKQPSGQSQSMEKGGKQNE